MLDIRAVVDIRGMVDIRGVKDMKAVVDISDTSNMLEKLIAKISVLLQNMHKYLTGFVQVHIMGLR